MIDRERMERERNKQFDDDGNLIVPTTEEQELLKEMTELLDFTKKNRQCLEKVFEKSKKEKEEALQPIVTNRSSSIIQ